MGGKVVVGANPQGCVALFLKGLWLSTPPPLCSVLSLVPLLPGGPCRRSRRLSHGGGRSEVGEELEAEADHKVPDVPGHLGASHEDAPDDHRQDGVERVADVPQPGTRGRPISDFKVQIHRRFSLLYYGGLVPHFKKIKIKEGSELYYNVKLFRYMVIYISIFTSLMLT